MQLEEEAAFTEEDNDDEEEDDDASSINADDLPADAQLDESASEDDPGSDEDAGTIIRLGADIVVAASFLGMQSRHNWILLG